MKVFSRSVVEYYYHFPIYVQDNSVSFSGANLKRDRTKTKHLHQGYEYSSSYILKSEEF